MEENNHNDVNQQQHPPQNDPPHAGVVFNFDAPHDNVEEEANDHAVNESLSELDESDFDDSYGDSDDRDNDGNSDSDDGDDEEQEQEQDDEEQEDDDDDDEDEVFFILDPAEQDRICTKVIAILQQRLAFPSQQRECKIVQFAQQFLDNVGLEEHEQDDDDEVEVFVILDPAEQDRICTKVIAILQQRFAFPSQQRECKIVQFAQEFLDNVGHDIQTMITDPRIVTSGEGNAQRSQYRGLDDTRDTEAEITTAIGFYPHLLAERAGPNNMYPIQYLPHLLDTGTVYLSSIKAVSFIYIFAKLAIEYNSFEEEERGGLLIENSNGVTVLQTLLATPTRVPSDDMLRTLSINDVDQYRRRVDTKFLETMIRLQQSDDNYFKKDDIKRYYLPYLLCRMQYFAGRRFRFLIDWDPSSLVHTDDDGYLPLHWSIHNNNNINAFQTVFDAGLRYYPRMRGILLLFQRNNFGQTAFQFACKKLESRKTVMEIVEGTISQHFHRSTITATSTTTTTAPTQNAYIGDTLISAAIDDGIHLDCVYFLVRRQPDIILSMLRRKNTVSNARVASLPSNNTRRNKNTNNNSNGRRGRDSNDTDNEGGINGQTNNNGNNKNSKTRIANNATSNTSNNDNNGIDAGRSNRKRKHNDR